MEGMYKIIEFDNSEGFGYYFNIDCKCRYTLMFDCLDDNKYIFEFDKTESPDNKSINYKLVRDSICKVIYNFLRENPKRVIFTVYDDDDNDLDKVRFRLFNSWFKYYNESKEFKKINFSTSKNEIVSIIFMSNNIEFIKELGLGD